MAKNYFTFFVYFQNYFHEIIFDLMFFCEFGKLKPSFT